MPSLSEEIVGVLKESQSNVHSHQRLLKTLRVLHDKHTDDLEAFFEAYFKPFSNALVVFKREPAAQRVMEFTAKFAISTAPESPESRETFVSQQESGKTHHTNQDNVPLDQHNYLFSLTLVHEEESESEEEPDMSFFSLLLDQLLSLHDAQGKGVR